MSEQITRRDAIKRAIYIAPVILTLTAVPAFASNGSGDPRPMFNPNLGLRKTIQTTEAIKTTKATTAIKTTQAIKATTANKATTVTTAISNGR